MLLRFGDDAPSGDELANAAREREVPLKVVTIHNEEARILYESKLVLVRPDGQSAWRGDSEPADPFHVIDVVRGAVGA